MKNEYQTSVSLNYWMSMNFNGKDFAMADELLKYVKTDNVFDDACEIIVPHKRIVINIIINAVNFDLKIVFCLCSLINKNLQFSL